jgi:membrane protease YdiL (CAAX protease family)
MNSRTTIHSSPQPDAGCAARSRPNPGLAALGALAVFAVWWTSPVLIGAPVRNLVWLLLGAPVVEEIVFRVGLHECLLRALVTYVRRWPLWSANLAVALAFAVAHAVARPDVASAATLIPALAIGALYQRHRRVWPCIALHAAFNAVGVLFIPLVS